MRRYLAPLIFALSLSVGYAGSACVHAPTTLSPVGQQAFNNTRVIKTLDLLRDFAVDANAQEPPIVSTPATRKVVLYHESTLKIIHATSGGWKPAVRVGLDELLKDLPAPDAAKLAPYVALLNTILAEVN